MNKIRSTLAILALGASLLIGAGSALAQDEPDDTAQCASIEQSQAQLDAQVAQFDASIAQQRAQIDAYDAALGPAYDVIFANYRAYLNTAEVSFATQVALAQAQLDAGAALYGC